jgi:hypothetical protein
MHDHAYDRARDWALRYRALGYNPLPSRMDAKGPALPSFAEYWDRPLPADVFDDWQTTNIQIMTGARWGLAVVDCDGTEAHTVFRRMKEHHGVCHPFRTWVAHTGGGGLHYYFTLPPGLAECPSRRLWGVWDTWAGTDPCRPGSRIKGDWKKHLEVRLLADRALVIAPPSLHVKTGARYEFLPGRGPEDYDRPAEAPDWLLGLPAIGTPDTRPPAPHAPAPPPPARPPGPGGTFSRDRVLAQIQDKVALARSWGLRFASTRPNAHGWLSCYAIDRDDRHPSASFHAETGIYHEQREGAKLSLFDLGVALGAYADWRDACNDLGGRFAAA